MQTFARRAPKRNGAFGTRLVIALLTPFILVLIVSFALPIASAFVSSMSLGGQPGQEYLNLLHDSLYWEVTLRTFRFALLVTVICLLLAYPMAEAIAGASPRWQPALLLLIVVPLWSSTIARTYGWFGIFRGDGLYERVSQILGFGEGGLLFSDTAVIVGLTNILLPVMLLPVYAAVRAADPSLIRASLSLGAGRFRTLIAIKLPLVSGTLVATSTVVFVVAVGFFIAPAVLGGPRSSTVSGLIYQQVSGVYNFQKANAYGMTLVATTLALVFSVWTVSWGLRKVLRRG